MPYWISKTLLLVAALACVFVMAGCGSGDQGGSGGADKATNDATTAKSIAPSKTPEAPKGTPTVPALSEVEKADGAASGWNKDAALYAIASITPQVDAKGRAPGWLYSYVSPSAGAVVSVSIQGKTVELEPQQKLPSDQIKDISNHALPSAGKLLDSSEAIKKAGKVTKALESKPGTDASAGLDSFSSESPVWIFALAQSGQRVEEKITATRSGGS
jgi:hypothetical protein